MKMTKESLAALLNGREYGAEITKEEAKQAKAAGLVVIYGASDDNMEFEGAIYDEISAYEGATAVMYKHNSGANVVPADSEVVREIEDDFLLWCALGALMDRRNNVEAVWGPAEIDASWLIKTELPHTAFDIVEDGELYCRGLVIDIADLA